jgi:rhodanese-related sulfurtransferase
MGVTNTSAHLQVLGRSRLVAQAGRGNVIVLDVRPAAEFVARHIPGALSV